MSNFFQNPTRPAFAVGVLSTLLAASSAFGSPIPANLGNGLDLLVRERLATNAAAGAKGRGAVVDAALVREASAVRDYAFTNAATDQVLVYVHLKPGNGRAFTPESILPAGAKIQARDMSYRNGVLEVWVGVDDVITLAKHKMVSSVILAVKPVLDIGAATTQGVVQHRVNLITQDGTGITIGAMSDSYAKTTTVTAAADVASGDLPGPGNPFGNTTPVAIIDDPITGADEGRAMLQIIHDLAPKAKLGFATASNGQVSFAENIRSLAGLPSGPRTQPGFAADVIVDDLFYSDSPMFGTSIVGKAVNEVAALGISYFSSAGNRPAGQGYFADFNFVSAADLPAALAGTNITPAAFTAAVPANLYAGGFHNFRTDGGRDVAQLMNRGATTTAANISFQWDDPYDVSTPTFNPTPIFTGSGTATSTTVASAVSVPGLTQGTRYRVTVTAQAGSTLDAVVTIKDPSGTTVLTQDTGLDEEIFFFAPATGTYSVETRAFDTASTGAYDLNVYTASGTATLTSDFNLHFFTEAGVFIKSIAAQNFQTNQPIEFGSLTFTPNTTTSKIQLVITRANIPTAPQPATKIRYVCTGLAGPDEYYNFQTPITFGHNHEPGCISAAAYSPFRPYLPEDFTSPGPSYIYFDQNGVRLPAPVIRQKPDVAALDGGNNTFFSGDTTADTDTQPNFYGTSAAAPHAAAIAGLVLQAKGGPRSVTQPQMRSILQRAGFQHDLDPYRATAVARTSNGGKITVNVHASASNFNNSDARSLSTNDRNVFSVTYVGPGSVSSMSINVANANPTGGNDVVGNVPGLAWDPRAYTYGTSASGTTFTVGSTTGGLTAGNISSAYSIPAPSPATTGFSQLDLTFAAGTFVGGAGFTFAADRDEVRTQAVTTAASGFGNSGDLFGAGVNIPSGTIAPGGATLTGTMSDGSTFSTTFVNKIGKGYSTLDGYGFINAELAVSLPLD
ncbi:MAG: S8 family serine peptidase [Verrucomicrobia bacterium]|nr:S8 family serine peptidase [Verrucomicrobiota bacterium]